MSGSTEPPAAQRGERLQERGYELVDTQMLTEHTERMGAFEVPRDRYLEMLKRARSKQGVRFD